MTQGYIKLHRNLLDNPIIQKPEYNSIWTCLLLMANHKDTTFIFNNKRQTLKAGQLITGRKALARKTKINESQVYKILKYLETEQQIELQSNNQFTTVTILNWQKYQGNGTTEYEENEQPSNSDVTTTQQPSNTYKNDKNIKNEKEEVYSVILDHWNSKKIMTPRALTDKLSKQIKIALKGYGKDKVLLAIDHYAIMLADINCETVTYKWTLEVFLKQNNCLPYFLDDGVRWINYEQTVEKGIYDTYELLTKKTK